MKNTMGKIKNGIVGLAVAGSALFASHLLNNYENLQNNLITNGTTSNLTESSLETKARGYSGPKKEARISWNEDEQTKTALYLQIEEWGDLSKTVWEKEAFGEKLTCKEPEDYTEAKWNRLVNPVFNDGIVHMDVKDFQTNIPNEEIDFALTKNPIRYGEDRILYAIFDGPKDIFEYLRDWKGPRIDRLIIEAHGYDRGLGQNKPRPADVGLDELLERYSPKDFSHVMHSGGHIYLQACAVNREYQHQLTVAEALSYLFDSPVTGAIKNLVGITQGLKGPSGIGKPTGGPVIVRWYDEKGDPNVGRVTFTPHKTVYPEDTKKEVLAYLSR